MSFDPHSQDSMFSQILVRIDQLGDQVKEHRNEVRTSFGQFQADNRAAVSRIEQLEQAAWRQRGFVAAIALVVPAAWQWLTKS
jgi:hypothetical protein